MIAPATTYGETLVAQGGLMRCCLETLATFVDAHADEPIVQGLVLDCAYERPGNGNMILEGATFRWSGPAAYRSADPNVPKEGRPHDDR